MALISQSLTMNEAGFSRQRPAVQAPRLLEALDNAVAYLDLATPASRISDLVREFAISHRCRAPGDYLFRAGATFHFFYVISAGFVKSCYVSEDGRARTTGIHLRGDVLGLDALATGAHCSDAIALEGCEVLAIPYETVIARCDGNPELVRELHRALSCEIRSERELMLCMSNLSADGRVATFLLEMSVRFAARGFSATDLQLHLTRQEIGSMLGLKLETVSRTLSRLARAGLISVCLREIVLLDREGLLDIVNPTGDMERDLR
jgi:CRP/FNR family transcriptional regulator